MMKSKYRTVGTVAPHESAHLHVSGRAQYTDDIPEWQGTLYGAFGLSERAHARITSTTGNPCSPWRPRPTTWHAER